MSSSRSDVVTLSVCSFVRHLKNKKNEKNKKIKKIIKKNKKIRAKLEQS
jgi:formiminotetrahydrofolate cyclodeaminase